MRLAGLVVDLACDGGGVKERICGASSRSDETIDRWAVESFVDIWTYEIVDEMMEGSRLEWSS